MSDPTADDHFPESDPANELERQLAVIYCRLNTWRRPITGEEMTKEEVAWIRSRLHIINHAKSLATDSVNQRVWMQGNQQWKNYPERS